MSNSFRAPDYLNAKETFIKWQGTKAESVDEYIIRQRKAELNSLVKKVIRQELTPYDRMIVELKWYKNMSPAEIAVKLGIDRSTVTRHLEKINNTIYEKLKYAMEYRYGNSFSKEVMFTIKNGDAYTCTVNPDEISGRVQNLRTNQCLSLGDVSELTGIAPGRLSEIEKQGNRMTMTELKKLSTFYRCSSDYILFGQ